MKTDVAHNKLQLLLSTIESLYSGIVTNIIHRRITSFHAISRTCYDNDVRGSLLTYIHSVEINIHNQPTPVEIKPILNEPVIPHAQNHHRIETTEPIKSAENHDNELANHFKKYNANTELATSLCDKLKTSAWEHTHTAIRLAHLHDFVNAKLHADLANNAIYELGHYMSESDFNQFRNAINAELADKS
jgi:hypothetical protein